MSKPRDPHPVADDYIRPDVAAKADDLADHLMPGNDVWSVYRQVSLGHVQVGAAHPARRHGDQDFVLARFCDLGVDILRGLAVSGPGEAIRHADIIRVLTSPSSVIAAS